MRSTMRQLAQVMAFTHQQGITHRDIKPENVLLQDNGKIALCDFGISKDIVSGAYESTMNLSAAGTLAYCAPEAGKSWLLQSCNPVYTSCVEMHIRQVCIITAPQDHLACGLSNCLTSSWSAVRFLIFRNLVYEQTMGQVDTGCTS